MGKGISVMLLVMVAIIAGLIADAYYRWDQKVLAPVAYKVGMQMDWYVGKEVSLKRLKVATIDDLERKLERQGFVGEREPSENEENFSTGFHRKEDGLHWYTFKVDEDSVVYEKEFLVAWGLCSQSAGVAISSSDNESVRLLNPGGTCV
jgi:hypothetical protein